MELIHQSRRCECKDLQQNSVMTSVIRLIFLINLWCFVLRRNKVLATAFISVYSRQLRRWGRLKDDSHQVTPAVPTKGSLLGYSGTDMAETRSLCLKGAHLKENLTVSANRENSQELWDTWTHLWLSSWWRFSPWRLVNLKKTMRSCRLQPVWVTGLILQVSTHQRVTNY